MSSVPETYRGIILSKLPIANLVELTIIGDGSCFFHAVLRAYSKEYLQLRSEKDRMEMCMKFRYQLADTLTEVVGGKMIYDRLYRGELREFSKGYPPATLESMQKELRSTAWVDNLYHELISNILSIDIYLVDLRSKDLYFITSDLKLLYRNRRSVFLAVVEGHFNLVGVMSTTGTIETLFDPQDPLVVTAYNRLVTIINERKK